MSWDFDWESGDLGVGGGITAADGALDAKEGGGASAEWGRMMCQ